MKKMSIVLIIILIVCCLCLKKENQEEYKKIITVDNLNFDYVSYCDDLDDILFDEVSNVLKYFKNCQRIKCQGFVSDNYFSYLLTFQNDKQSLFKSFNYDKETLKKVNLNAEIARKYQNSYWINFIIMDNQIVVYLFPKDDNKEITCFSLELNNNYLYIDTTKNNKKIALTFDDGPSIKTQELVDLLDELDVRATFFVLGCNIKDYPDNLKYIDNHNHEIGNHSYSHPDFKKISLSMALKEIKETQELVYQILGYYPHLFRFPYGSVNNEVLNTLNIPIIFWSADSLDWKYQSDDDIYNKVLNETKENGVILFHDSAKYKRSALTKVIATLKEEGYEFVTVSELFDFLNEEKIINGKIYY